MLWGAGPGDTTTGVGRLQSRAVPEAPDLAVLAGAAHAALVGRRVRQIDITQPLVMRATPTDLQGLEGQRLDGVARRGKFLDFRFDVDRVVINPMLTGRLGVGADPLTGRRRGGSKPAATVTFGARESPVPSPEEWTVGAAWVPTDDEPAMLRYFDPTRMGKVYALPSGVPRAVAGWDEQGPDADDPAFTLAQWRARIRSHRGELKNVLRNQAFAAGIGNGYSDEILWAARLAPFRARTSLAGEEIDRLFDATREVLSWATEVLRTRVPPHFEVEVRDFLRVHRKGGQACPRCGSPLTQIAPGGFVTTYCRACQR